MAADFLATQVVESSYIQDLTRQLAGQERVIALRYGGRLTLIDSSGRVFADSDADSAH